MSDAASYEAGCSGLTSTEAAKCQQNKGYNELPRTDRRTVPAIILEVLREPMLALLLAGGLGYLLLGDTKEAIILLAFATLSVAITVIQESRTEKVLEALRGLTNPRALVVRDGHRVRISGRDVVRGDLIILSEGGRIPADAVLAEANDLEIDESLLAGEPVPVRKLAAPACAERRPERLGDDDRSYVFSGTLVVRGTEGPRQRSDVDLLRDCFIRPFYAPAPHELLATPDVVLPA